MKTINHREKLLKRLKSRTYALGLLEKAFEESCSDGNWQAFGIVLEDVIQARCAKKAFTDKAEMSRQHLLRLLGKNADPTLQTLLPVLFELGFRLTVSTAQEERRRKSAWVRKQGRSS